MSNEPLISVKAGKCDVVDNHVIPLEQSGTLYLYHNEEEDLVHLAWKRRSATQPEEEDDLIVFPGDAELIPYNKTPPDNGRILVLKFTSSNQRKFFWLQSKSQKEDDLAFYSGRDLSLARRFNALIMGEDVEVDEDLLMEELGAMDSNDSHHEPATHDAIAAALNNPNSNQPPMNLMELLQSMQRGGSASTREQTLGALDSLLNSQSAEGDAARQAVQGLTSGAGGPSRGSVPPSYFISLGDVLSPKDTLPLLYKPDILGKILPRLLENLPPGLVPEGASDRETIQVLERVLRSPQLTQALSSLTAALREGALENIADSMQLDVSGSENGGVGGLIDAVKREVEKDGDEGDAGASGAAGDDQMDVDN